MWIVAVAWVFVVGLMGITEAYETRVVAGIMTFVFYCVVPLSILFYLTGGKRRRAKRAKNEEV
jgi:TM2 domain-containing membrane protein YozV